MSGSYASRKEIDKQYRPKGYGLSPGLQRARAPFRTRNAITGLLIGAFVVGVWAYSIRAVRQDTFEDLDEEAKALLDSRRTAVAVVDDKVKAVGAAEAEAVSSDLVKGPSTVAAAPTSAVVAGTAPVRGVLASQLVKYFPNALDPASKTLVWGAPPVERIGRLGDKVDRPS
ncbi:hypothetical protein M0805_007283 [Coniferiporia weirii]|nr:hypothetical protein M0805_007283 [Coniferiporia weirii]